MALSKRIRFEVFKRDGFTCQYCGRRPDDGVTVLEVDHIHPLAAGGSNDEMNLITACQECNNGKRAKLLAEVAPKPDADLKTLEVQQELAELKRYQEAVAAREAVLIRVVESLQQVWFACSDLEWCPADSVIRQFLNKYPPDVVEEAIRDVAPKVASDYLPSKRGTQWIPYMWAVMRNLEGNADANA